MPADLPVFVITGQLAAGKSTLARALLDRYPFGIHIDVDAIREMVASGLASPLQWTDETQHQFDLAIRGAAVLAGVYVHAAFAVAIEGAIDPAVVERELERVGLRDRMVGVELAPPVEVALVRNRERTTKPFDTAILDDVIRRLDADIRSSELPPGWTRIDNGAETVPETVERVLAAAERPA